MSAIEAGGSEFALEPTGLVSFRSAGRLLIIGTPVDVQTAVDRLPDAIEAFALLTEAPRAKPVFAFATRLERNPELTGQLGAYVLNLSEEGQSAPRVLHFDLVLDLGETPVFDQPLPPLGYFRAEPDRRDLQAIVDELPQWVGQFEKPQYFAYDASICAHARRGVPGCTRCIDACPAQAIISIGESVQVNPQLCQGGGICATVCPSGAISYQYPPRANTLERLRNKLQAHAEGSADRPRVSFYGVDDERTPSATADGVQMPLEELASAGLEVWLTALACGAASIDLLRPVGLPRMVEEGVEQQRQVANAILTTLGFPPAVQWADAASTEPMPPIAPAKFSVVGSKRQVLFAALDYLADHAQNKPDSAPLPPGAPMGQVLVDRAACTLCLACVSVCPANALGDGGDRPALRFFEVNCLQCGLCETACPENAIRLANRILFDPDRRRLPQTLNEEAPFLCVSCGKPFATKSAIEHILGKLQGHWMFPDAQSKQRLKMCEDCRVKDMMTSAS